MVEKTYRVLSRQEYSKALIQRGSVMMRGGVKGLQGYKVGFS